MYERMTRLHRVWIDAARRSVGDSATTGFASRHERCENGVCALLKRIALGNNASSQSIER